MMPDRIFMVGCGRMGGAIARTLAGSPCGLAFDPQAELPPGPVPDR